MLKKIFFIFSASSILLFSNCASKKKPSEVTDSYKEEVAVEQPKMAEPPPLEIENKPSKFDNGGISMDKNTREIKEEDGTITTPAKAKQPLTEKEKEAIKQKMRERMKAEKKEVDKENVKCKTAKYKM
jgi:hypothetical protein